MKKTIKSIEKIENRCLNNGKSDFFNKAVAAANEQGLKQNTKPFLGMVRRLVEWQEYGLVVLG